MSQELDSPLLLADIGAFLRRTRESQGKTLDDAAAVTRIGKNYLTAIEEGDETRFPSTAYLKGFLRIYARYLELSGDEIIAGRQWLRSAALPATHDTACPSPEEHDGKQKTLRWWIIPLVLTVLSAVFASIMERPAAKHHQPATVEGPGVTALPPVQSARSSVSAPPRVTAVTEEAGETTSAEDQPQRGGILKFKVNQDSSLNITIDDTISEPYELKAGDLIEWKAEHGFVIDVSNAGGIDADYNGRQLHPLGEPGKSAHIVLK